LEWATAHDGCRDLKEPSDSEAASEAREGNRNRETRGSMFGLLINNKEFKLRPCSRLAYPETPPAVQEARWNEEEGRWTITTDDRVILASETGVRVAGTARP